MNRFAKYAVIPTLLSVLSFSVFADTTLDNTDKVEQRQQNRIERLFDGITLTDTQKQSIKALLQTEMKQAKTKSDMKKEMNALALSNEFDEAKARSLIEAQANQRQERQIERLKLKNELFNILTPEQQTQFTANMEKRESLNNNLKHHRNELRKEQRQNRSNESRRDQNS